jgi:hypothetical protein
MRQWRKRRVKKGGVHKPMYMWLPAEQIARKEKGREGSLEAKDLGMSILEAWSKEGVKIQHRQLSCLWQKMSLRV